MPEAVGGKTRRHGLRQTPAASAPEQNVGTHAAGDVEPQRSRCVVRVNQREAVVHQLFDPGLPNGSPCLRHQGRVEGHRRKPVLVLQQVVEMSGQRSDHLRRGARGPPLEVGNELEVLLIQVVRFPEHQIRLEILVQLLWLRPVIHQPLTDARADERYQCGAAFVGVRILGRGNNRASLIEPPSHHQRRGRRVPARCLEDRGDAIETRQQSAGLQCAGGAAVFVRTSRSRSRRPTDRRCSGQS